MLLSIRVFGKPKPQGSKKVAYGRDGQPMKTQTGRVVLRDDDEQSRPWRQDVSKLMLEARPLNMRPWDEAVEVRVTVYMARPAGHFGRRGLKGSAPPYPDRGGVDLDKVQRAIGDAGTRIWWFDDKRIAKWIVTREWCDDHQLPECVVIEAIPRLEAEALRTVQPALESAQAFGKAFEAAQAFGKAFEAAGFQRTD